MADVNDLRLDHHGTPERGRVSAAVAWTGLLLMGLAIAAAVWLAWPKAEDHAAPPDARVIPASMEPTAGAFTVGGYLEVAPPGPAAVGAPVEGRIGCVLVVEGDTVAVGQEIARIDDTPHRRETAVRESEFALARAKLARMEAGFREEELAAADARVEAAASRLELAESIHARAVRLMEIGAGTAATLEAAVADMEQACAAMAERTAEAELLRAGQRPVDIHVARAEAAAALAALEMARWRVEACVVRSPVAGVVMERFVQPGDWLSPAAGSRRPGAVISIADPRAVSAWVDVNQRDMGRVQVGQPVTITTDSDPGRPIPGRVSRILPVASMQKNTVQVKVEIPDPPPGFRPEMSVKVTFIPIQPAAVNSSPQQHGAQAHAVRDTAGLERVEAGQ